ncbi:uncharacterized protein TNCV_3551071 [Trichonephila clavipes]|nr:uncharacterized protein TNCV_3551071 [Trichonephila clavipes]
MWEKLPQKFGLLDGQGPSPPELEGLGRGGLGGKFSWIQDWKRFALMAKQKSSQSLFAAVVLLTILSTYKASSTRRCKYSSFVSDIVMESCVRRALASKLKIDHVTEENMSQLSEYTDIWKECKEASIGSSCYTYKHHNSVILEMKIQIINIWNELVKLAQTWGK